MKNSGAMETAILAVGWNAENHEKKLSCKVCFPFSRVERTTLNEILDFAFEF
jgi:hypothetical protein